MTLATEGFYSVSEAATFLFVSHPFVMKLVKQGELELHHGVAGSVLITRASLLRYLTKQEAAWEAYQALAGKDE